MRRLERQEFFYHREGPPVRRRLFADDGLEKLKEPIEPDEVDQENSSDNIGKQP